MNVVANIAGSVAEVALRVEKKRLLNNLVRVPDMVLNLSINKLRITHQNHQRTYGSLKGLMNQTTHTILAYANLLSSKKMP